MINPELQVTDYTKRTYDEACASVCGYKGEVTRHAGVTLTGLNPNGEKQTLHLKGWNARIAQHEMDHLSGIMYTDVMNRQTFSCTCWHMVNLRSGDVRLAFGPK